MRFLKTILGKMLVGAIVIIASVAITMIWGLKVRTFDAMAQVVELGLLAFGLLSLLLIAEQTRLNVKWNKLLSYHQFFGDLIKTETLEKLYPVAESCGFKTNIVEMVRLSDEHVTAILATDSNRTTVCSYLDEFEEFCGAVHAGVMDEDYAYTLEAFRVIRVWAVFEPLALKLRGSNKYSRCYLELQRLGHTWLKRRDDEAAKKKEEDDKANNNAGVRPQV